MKALALRRFKVGISRGDKLGSIEVIRHTGTEGQRHERIVVLNWEPGRSDDGPVMVSLTRQDSEADAGNWHKGGGTRSRGSQRIRRGATYPPDNPCRDDETTTTNSGAYWHRRGSNRGRGRCFGYSRTDGRASRQSGEMKIWV